MSCNIENELKLQYREWSGCWGKGDELGQRWRRAVGPAPFVGVQHGFQGWGRRLTVTESVDPGWTAQGWRVRWGRAME